MPLVTFTTCHYLISTARPLHYIYLAHDVDPMLLLLPLLPLLQDSAAASEDGRWLPEEGIQAVSAKQLLRSLMVCSA